MVPPRKSPKLLVRPVLRPRPQKKNPSAAGNVAIIGGVTAAGIGIGVLVWYLTSKPGGTACESPDMPMTTSGICPSGYVADPSSTGCCMPSTGCTSTSPCSSTCPNGTCTSGTCQNGVCSGGACGACSSSCPNGTCSLAGQTCINGKCGCTACGGPNCYDGPCPSGQVCQSPGMCVTKVNCPPGEEMINVYADTCPPGYPYRDPNNLTCCMSTAPSCGACSPSCTKGTCTSGTCISGGACCGSTDDVYAAAGSSCPSGTTRYPDGQYPDCCTAQCLSPNTGFVSGKCPNCTKQIPGMNCCESAIPSGCPNTEPEAYCRTVDDCTTGYTCTNCCCTKVVTAATPTITVSPSSLTPSGSSCSGCFTVSVTGADSGDNIEVYDTGGTYWGSTNANSSGVASFKACVDQQYTAENLTFYVKDNTSGTTSNQVTVSVAGGCTLPDSCTQYGCGKDAGCPAGCSCQTGKGGSGTCHSTSGSPSNVSPPAMLAYGYNVVRA